ncbi:MAG: GNAT family N-acetyltransferase [Bryobacteraceae bacterium]
MAAQLQAAPDVPDLVDLRQLTARDLDPVLREEIASWRQDLEWDFQKSADLVRRFVEGRALSGLALRIRGSVVGYLYYVLEDRKGLIGDLYILREYRTVPREDLLLGTAVEAMISSRVVSRIEAQLLMLDYAQPRQIPRNPFAGIFERNFMRVDLLRPVFPETAMARPVRIEVFSDHDQDAAAQLIADAYHGHIDSRINDQYRSVSGARAFLFNIVQYPGCGSFSRPASFSAFDAAGRLCGISLASLVAPETGHLTQICVLPEFRGAGIGRALIRRSLTRLAELGCRSTSLTVTAANQGAVALYQRIGFRIARRFPAYAWEGF